MSEINNNEVTPEVTPEELVTKIRYKVKTATVIPSAIDPTLTIPNEAADAYATGQAIAEVLNGLRINGKEIVEKILTLYGTDILMSSAEGAVSIPTAIQNVENRTASDIMYDTVNLISIADEIDGIKTNMNTELTDEEIDEIFDEVFSEEEGE